jgi:threonine dehydrogenase-like Zn-dependent dehydrogenase
LIIGLGPVGLAHLLVRSFAGATVWAIEPSAYRRELALKLGAVRVLSPGEPIGCRPSLVIECTGRPDCVALALDVVDNGGTVLQSGESHEDIPVNPSDTFIRREVNYTRAWYYASEDYSGMLELATSGLPLTELCTHRVAAADAQSAISDFLEGRSGKVIIRWGDPCLPESERCDSL